MSSFVQNKTSLNYFMHESAKKALKRRKSQLKTYFLAYDYDLQFQSLQHNNIYQIELCANFRAKQTKFELL